MATLTNSGGTLSNGTYNLTSNIILTNNITITGNVTIDLNGFVLSGNGTGSTITVNGNLTIIDSNPTKDNYGTLDTEGLWIYSNGTGDTLIQGGVITNKGAGKGIAVNAICKMQGGSVAGCKGNFGSAVTASSSGNFSISNGKVLYNKTTNTSSGGAIYGEPAHGNTGSFISISNSQIIYNNSNGHAGGILGYKVEIKDNSIISNNIAINSGGGVMVDNNATGENTANAYLLVENSSINNNTCGAFGGGIYSAGDLTVTNSNINYNICGTDESDIENGTRKNRGRGGGIYLSQSKEGKTANGLFNNINLNYNKAMYYGGGIQLTGKNASVTMNSGSINYNETYLGGASGIHVTDSSTFTINEGNISYNKCEGRGGAIHSAYGCTLNLNGGTISNNEVIGRGGGVHVNVGGIIHLNGTLIQENKALSGYRTQYCKLENKIFTKLITDDMVFEEGYGGGVVIDCGEFNMAKGEISSNYAEKGGGGVALVMFSVSPTYDNKIVKCDISGGSIINNSTNGNGGGVYLMRNNLGEMDREEYPNITDELIAGIPTFTTVGGIISNNYAKENGGAAYMEENTEFYMSDNAILSDNYANGNGGGIFIAEGLAKISGGIVENNTSLGDGGAFYVNGDFTMISGNLLGNTAVNFGGAVYANNGNIIIGVENCEYTKEDEYHSVAPFTNLKHPIIKNNISTYGGAFFINGSGTKVVLYCGTLNDNFAYQNGNNVYLENGILNYYDGAIGMPHDAGFIIMGGSFNDLSGEFDSGATYEVHYHSVAIPTNENNELIYNGRIPLTKWGTSPKGNDLYRDDDSSSLTWGEIFAESTFMGWQNDPAEEKSNEIVNLYAIWEEK